VRKFVTCILCIECKFWFAHAFGSKCGRIKIEGLHKSEFDRLYQHWWQKGYYNKIGTIESLHFVVNESQIKE
jgi:hypothetical protein